MRKLLYICLILLLPAVGWTATVDCAANCTDTALTAAIVSAGVDGTVNILAGSYTWTGQVSITRGIKIVGAGDDASYITRAGTAFSYTPTSTARANGEVFELSGINLNRNGAGRSIFLIGDNPVDSNPVDPAIVYIHDITLRNAGDGGSNFTFHISGHVTGVIADSTFDRMGHFIQWLGGDSGDVGSYCTGYSFWNWGSLPEYGSDDFLYLEHNNFTWSSNWPYSDPGWIETGQGAPGIVIRYNTYDYTNQETRGEIWDFHGLQGISSGCLGDSCSTMAGEYYGNIFTSYSGGRLMNDRGGKKLMFNNKLATSSSIQLYGFTGGANCEEDCTLPAGEQETHNTYYWNNMLSTTVRNADWYSDPPCGLAENVDFFNYSASCSGSGTCDDGIGIGTTAPTGDCDATGDGVGFWVWSQGTTLPSDMDDMITYTQAGDFYKCTSANVWEKYYEPYTYPHPLREAAVAVPANAIQGVTIN